METTGLATIIPGTVLERAEGPMQVTSKGLTPVRQRMPST